MAATWLPPGKHIVRRNRWLALPKRWVSNCWCFTGAAALLGAAVGRWGELSWRVRRKHARRISRSEQGEVIFARYGHPAIAERHFQQVISSLLLSSLGAAEDAPQAEWVAMMERLATSSHTHYAALVKHSPDFLAFFRLATPFPELGSLPLASRPVSRAGNSPEALTFDDLRAIPWVFSWTQIRANLPGWFGLGTA